MSTTENPFASDQDYQLFCQERLPDPYPLFDRLRALEPVHWCEPMSLWLVTGFEDVLSGLRNPRLSSDRTGMYVQALPPALKTRVQPLLDHIAKWIQLTDEPDHARLRKLVNQAFTPKLIRALQPRIVTLAQGLLSDIATGQPFDLVEKFCRPLPAIVICELLGIPEDERQRFQAATAGLMQFSSRGGPALKGHAEPAMAALGELVAMFEKLVEARRHSPQPDLLSALVTAETGGKGLSSDELYAMCVFIFLAGHETTTSGIGSGILALLQHPDEFSRLRGNLDLAEGAVEETLRYESPVPRAVRRAKEAIEMGGKMIAAGQLVVLLLSAANRDPSAFPDPGRFDIRRKTDRHLAFGQGLHFCLGAILARVEMEIAFRAIALRLPALQLVERAPAWKPIMGVRSLQRLLVVTD